VKVDSREVARVIELLKGPDDVWELRILRTREGTISGYFNKLAPALQAIEGVNGSGSSVYVTLNPVEPALLARAANRLKPRADKTTSDKDITKRRFFVCDVDATRPTDISATEAELEAALDRCRTIRFELSELGWPAPIFGHSGNGGHLIWAIDLPNDSESEKLIQRVLKALAARFDDEAVHVDKAVFNASRIIKLYGTIAAKGDNIPERPHRLSRILDAPARLEPVPRALLEELAATLKEPDPPRPGASASKGQFDIEAFLARHHLKTRPSVPHEGGRKFVLEACPFNSDHRAPDAAIFQFADGSLGFKCFHSSCSGKGWRNVRELFEGQRPSGQTSQAGASPAHEQSPQAGSLLMQSASEIEARPLHWLWRRHIPRGKLSLLVGNPGLGKTLVTAYIVAIVTTGGLWPSGDRATSGDVIFLSAEDDPADTLRPRLEAVGADLSRVHILQGVIAGYTGEGRRRTRMFDLQQDVEALRQKLAEIGNVAVVVVDPLTAYMGSIDSHKNSEVRGVLAPLSELAGESGAAIVGVSHLNKQTTGPEALLRVAGSIAIVAAARAAYLVVPDPSDKSRRFFLPIKNNLSPDSSGLAFRVEGVTISAGTIETARVVWDPDPITVTADEVVRPQAPSEESVLGQAIEWLQWTLRAPTLASEVYKRAAETNFSKMSVRRASEKLNVQKRKAGLEGRWTWSLPDVEDAQGAQGAQAGDSLSTFDGDTPSTPNIEPLEHVEHLGESKELRGQNKVLNPNEHLEHLRRNDQASLLPDDDEFTEVEL
jgi:hypothetical protein